MFYLFIVCFDKHKTSRPTRHTKIKKSELYNKNKWPNLTLGYCFTVSRPDSACALSARWQRYLAKHDLPCGHGPKFNCLCVLITR